MPPGAAGAPRPGLHSLHMDRLERRKGVNELGGASHGFTQGAKSLPPGAVFFFCDNNNAHTIKCGPFGGWLAVTLDDDAALGTEHGGGAVLRKRMGCEMKLRLWAQRADGTRELPTNANQILLACRGTSASIYFTHRLHAPSP